jgi:hypothetical protein
LFVPLNFIISPAAWAEKRRKRRVLMIGNANLRQQNCPLYAALYCSAVFYCGFHGFKFVELRQILIVLGCFSQLL